MTKLSKTNALTYDSTNLLPGSDSQHTLQEGLTTLGEVFPRIDAEVDSYTNLSYANAIFRIDGTR